MTVLADGEMLHPSLAYQLLLPIAVEPVVGAVDGGDGPDPAEVAVVAVPG